MNTLVFLAGAGTGAFLAVMGMIVMMNNIAKDGAIARQLTLKTNSDSLDELRRLNDIGERQWKSIHMIAEHIEKYVELRNTATHGNQ